MVLPKTAFGEVAVAPLDVRAAWKFDYNINPLQVTATTSTDASAVTVDENRAKLAVAAAANSWAQIESVPVLTYMPGLGGLARFTAVFADPVAGSQQIIGIGDTDNGFFFGYNGTDFGVMRRSGSSDTWISVSDFVHPDNPNPTAFVNALSKTAGNIYQIRYQWLGYGGIEFEMEEPGSAGIVPVHLIQYAGSTDVTTIQQPSLPLFARIENTTNTSAIAMYTPSAMAAMEGVRPPHAPASPLHHTHFAEGSDTDVTTERPILSIRNDTTFYGVTNKNTLSAVYIAASAEGNRPVTIKGYKNATLTTDVSWSPVSTDSSFASIDTAATGSTDGTAIGLILKMDKAGAENEDINGRHVDLRPGDTLTLTAQSALTSEVEVALTWFEYW